MRGRNDADWIIGVHAFTDDRSVHADHWERHPRGDEVLCLLDGAVTVTLAGDATPQRQIVLQSGQALVVPCGVWHRLQVQQAGRLMFVTPGVGSEHRRVAGVDPAQPDPATSDSLNNNVTGASNS